MRLILGVCALAIAAGAASAQVRTSAPRDTIEVLRLSRQQAIAEALTRNAQLDVAREQIAEARARRVQAVAIPDPALTAAYDQSPGPFTFGTAASRPVSLGLDVPFPDKFRLNNRIGVADIRANEQNFRLQTQTVAEAASTSYDSLLVALAHRTVLTETRDLANDFLSRTQTRYQAGSAARLDVIQAQVAVAQANNDLIANEGEITAAQASLNRALGRVRGSPIVPTDTLALPAPLPDSATIETTALENRPELAILQQQRAGAGATTSLTKEFWLPDFTVAVQRDYAPQGGPALFTTGIALPLPLLYWQHSRGDIAQAQHIERELAATYRDTRAQVVQDVRTAYANAATAIKQAIFIRDELVPAAREQYRVSSTSYSLGGTSALEVLTARTALLQAESQLADAIAAASTARADLNRALGIPVTPGASNP